MNPEGSGGRTLQGIGRTVEWQRRRLAVTLQAAGTVSERARFILAEFSARHTIRTYTLHSGLKAVLRHPMTDVIVLRDIFARHEYRSPTDLQPERILDLGAHVGLFGLYARTLWPDVHVLSFEPDPRNLAVLERAVEANHLEDRWTVVPKAAGRQDGEAAFVSDYQLSQLASLGEPPPWETWMRSVPAHLEPQAVTVEVADVFPYMVGCDLVKLDIEGAEWDLLADPRFSAALVVMEVHHAARPDATRTLSERLGDRGLQILETIPHGDGTDIVWASRL